MAAETVVQAQRRAAQAAGRPWQLKRFIASGAGAAANIAVTGIKLGDRLFSVIRITATNGVPSDLTAEASITSAGNIQCSTTATTGDKLDVWYYTRRH